MKTKLFATLTAGILLLGNAVFAQDEEPSQDRARDQIRKQTRTQDAQGNTVQTQNRNQNRNQKANQTMNQNKPAQVSGSNDVADDTKGDGVPDRLRTRDRVGRSDANQPAMKRGRHRNRSANQTGQGQQIQDRNRAGRGFGEGYVDADGDGVCDNYQRRMKKGKNTSGPIQGKK